MACNYNPTKVIGSEKFLPALWVMLVVYSKLDPPTRKMLPVEADVPDLLVEMKAISNLSMIAFYYLLHIGEYMVKGK